MTLIVPQAFLYETQNSTEGLGDKSPSLRSSLSSTTNRTYRRNSRSSSFNQPSRLQAGPPIDIPVDLSDDENDLDDSTSARENSRFAPRIIRKRHSRRNSFQVSTTNQRYFPSSSRKTDLLVIQAPPSGTNTISTKPNSSQNGHYSSIIDHHTASMATNSLKDIRGSTLLHLAARLGHDEILRLLISETSQASMLSNKKGQTPLLTSIESGSTSTATLLMEADPRSIIASDINLSSVFHYACEHCNDVVLHRAIALSKRLNSTRDRITVSKSEKKNIFFCILF